MKTFVVIFPYTMLGIWINNNIVKKEVEIFSNKSEEFCIIYLIKLWKFIRILKFLDFVVIFTDIMIGLQTQLECNWEKE